MLSDSDSQLIFYPKIYNSYIYHNFPSHKKKLLSYISQKYYEKYQQELTNNIFCNNIIKDIEKTTKYERKIRSVLQNIFSSIKKSLIHKNIYEKKYIMKTTFDYCKFAYICFIFGLKHKKIISTDLTCKKISQIESDFTVEDWDYGDYALKFITKNVPLMYIQIKFDYKNILTNYLFSDIIPYELFSHIMSFIDFFDYFG